MKTESAERKTFRLSKRLAVEITVGAAGMVVEWDPEQPERLTEPELCRYRKARAKMLSRLAEMAGRNVVCVEV